MPFRIYPILTGIFIFLTLLGSGLFQSLDVYGAQSEYDLIACNFLSSRHSTKKINSIATVEGSILDSSNPILIAHLVTLEGGGYILISGSKSLTPIKAYSLKYDFDTLPDNYRDYLLLELEYGIRTLNERKKTLYKSSDITITDNQERWDFLLNYSLKSRLKTYEPNTYLIKTQWMQTAPYNKFCPQINGLPVKVGCTSVAVGQLMRYHNYPPAGKGVETYTWNGQQLKAIFYKNYHWENMPDSLSVITPEFQIDETARLLRDIAIANHSDFGTEATSARVNIDALNRYFGYATGIQTVTNSSEPQFFAILKNEIDAFRPVLLKFPGHMTIADGYSSDSTGREIHVNFGWGGNSDGYYFLDETVNTDSYPTPFTTDPGDLEMYYNIKPCTSDCFLNRESEDSIQGITINGKFNSHRDIDEYKVYLKGSTTINASRLLSIYNTQSFILKLFDYQRNMIASNNGEDSKFAPAIAVNLPAGKYTLQFSLCKEIDLCYPYEPYVYYTASIYTQALTTAEKESINALDFSPVINNAFEDMILGVSDNPHKILIDAVDEDGDDLSLSVTSTNSDITASIDGSDLLTITPTVDLTQGTGHITPYALEGASKITVSASAGNKTVQKSFFVLAAYDNTLFGKEIIISGLFENQSTFNKYRVILDGSCTVSGDNGYLTQGFYTSVMDFNGQFIITPVDKNIEDYFDENQFLIGASLAYGGYQYTYHYGVGDIYTIKILCPESDLEIEDIASMLRISLAGTGLENPPTLRLDTDKTCGSAPLQVQFFAIGQDYDGSIVSYHWDFGNGNTSTQRCPTYTFAEEGLHFVCCTVTDNDGITKEDMISILVYRDKIKIGTKDEVCQENCFEQWLKEGQNRVYMYNTTCGPYTTFDFLSDLKKKGRQATSRHRSLKSGSFAQSYWFFDRISGKENNLLEEIESSEEITLAEEAYYAVDVHPD